MPQQKSDDPRRGGKVNIQGKGAWNKDSNVEDELDEAKIVSAIVLSLQIQEKGGILRQDLQGAAAEGNSGRNIGGNIDVNTDRLTPEDNVDEIEPETDSMEDEEDELKPRRGTDTMVPNEDISNYNKKICVPNYEIYNVDNVTNYEIYNVDSVVTRRERGGDTTDALENKLPRNKDSFKPEVPGVALSSVPMIEISDSTITSIDQTKKQEKGNDIGPRVKDTGHKISKDCIEKTWGGIHGL